MKISWKKTIFTIICLMLFYPIAFVFIEAFGYSQPMVFVFLLTLGLGLLMMNLFILLSLYHMIKENNNQIKLKEINLLMSATIGLSLFILIASFLGMILFKVEINDYYNAWDLGLYIGINLVFTFIICIEIVGKFKKEGNPRVKIFIYREKLESRLLIIGGTFSLILIFIFTVFFLFFVSLTIIMVISYIYYRKKTGFPNNNNMSVLIIFICVEIFLFFRLIIHISLSHNGTFPFNTLLYIQLFSFLFPIGWLFSEILQKSKYNTELRITNYVFGLISLVGTFISMTDTSTFSLYLFRFGSFYVYIFLGWLSSDLTKKKFSLHNFKENAKEGRFMKEFNYSFVIFLICCVLNNMMYSIFPILVFYWLGWYISKEETLKNFKKWQEIIHLIGIISIILIYYLYPLSYIFYFQFFLVLIFFYFWLGWLTSDVLKVKPSIYLLIIVNIIIRFQDNLNTWKYKRYNERKIKFQSFINSTSNKLSSLERQLESAKEVKNYKQAIESSEAAISLLRQAIFDAHSSRIPKLKIFENKISKLRSDLQDYKSIEKKLRILQTLKQFSREFPRIVLSELINRVNIEEAEGERIVLDLIESKEIQADYDKKTKGITFQELPEEIKILMESYEQWEEGKGKKI